MILFIPTPTPFNLHSIVHSHGWVQLVPFLADDTGGGFTYIDRLRSGRVIDLHVSEAPGGIVAEVSAALDPDEQDELARHVAWMLELKQDLSTFYALARAEPKLAHMEPRVMGRVLRSATLFEDVVKTILTTNTLWGGTKRMVANLVDQFGDPLPADPTQRAFPTPQKLAESDLETLNSQARLGYRAPYILELARSVDSGRLDLEGLKYAHLPTPELRKLLLSIKGVGGYAAAHMLLLLGRYDEIPIDSWAMKMVSQEWHNGAPVGPAEVRAAFEHWGEWQGLAYWFWKWDSEQ